MMLCALWLSACASLPMPASEAEVRQRHGEPTRVWDNPDQTHTLEYATQPQGETCWMYTVDTAGRVTEARNALAPASLDAVRPDMTEAAVERQLGSPRSVQRFVQSGEEVWDWNIPRQWPDLIATRFNVHFRDGKVLRTSLSHEYPRDGWRLGIGIGYGLSPHWNAGWYGPWRRPWGW